MKYLASGSYIHENVVSDYKIGLKKLFILNSDLSSLCMEFVH